MRIKLASKTQRTLGRKRYVPITTSFVTEEGPSVGTIWFDRDDPKREPMIVSSVEYRGDGYFRVRYEFDWDSLGIFMRRVADGRYILIGVVPPTTSYTIA